MAYADTLSPYVDETAIYLVSDRCPIHIWRIPYAELRALPPCEELRMLRDMWSTLVNRKIVVRCDKRDTLHLLRKVRYSMSFAEVQQFWSDKQDKSHAIRSARERDLRRPTAPPEEDPEADLVRWEVGA